MSDQTAASNNAAPAEREMYTFHTNPAAESVFARRSASAEAAFFLPHLKSGMHLLDCGSGPGSITCDLAEVVAPGEVVGLDIQPEQVARARALASERGVSNARFEVGSVYALPFPDASFDAAFAHMVLLHLSDPGAALREIRRVLKPGGIVGIRDGDFSLWQFSPPTPLLEELKALHLRVFRHNGGSPFYASQQRALLLEAGFVRTEASAAFLMNGAGSLAKTQQAAEIVSAFLRGSAYRETAIGQGWVDEAGLDAMYAELQAWGERPDAFYALAQCAAVGWNAE
jgi:ubiquinone/menaquinone biosynthesis C-methylase UbiE